MKMQIILLTAILLCRGYVYAQDAKSEFEVRATALSWMPNGKALTLNIMKIDKEEKVPPVAKKFLYHIKQQKLKPLGINGSGVAIAPNGKSLVYLKPANNDIYLYHIKTKKEEVLLEDTLRKFGISWSPDGKNLLYNVARNGRGPNATVEVCIYNISTNQVKQITQSGKDKSYNPAWNPKNNKIVYYLEKGDGHDQIYLTDSEGSFHTNLTNDLNTHNYFPSWLDEQTILYTQSPKTIMTMNLDGSNRQKITGINAAEAKFNARTGKFAYLDENNNILLFDLKTKSSEVLLSGNQLDDSLFKK